jgi:hypothetical protein
MDYAEASYFDGYHFQHIAAFEENNRLKRIAKVARVAMRSIERRTGSRARLALVA